VKLFKQCYLIKNWEFFLLLFVIPPLTIINIGFIVGGFLTSSTLYLVLYAFIAFWLYRLSIDFISMYLSRFLIVAYRICIVTLYSFIFIIYIVPLNYQALGYESFMGFYSAYSEQSFFSTFLPLMFYGLGVFVMVTAAKILSAKILSRKPVFFDYYALALSFLFLPVGVFFIQNNINKLVGLPKIESTPKRGWLLIGASLFLLAITIFIVGFKSPNWKIQLGSETISSGDSHFGTSVFEGLDFFEKIDSFNAEELYDAAMRKYQNYQFREAIDYLNHTIKLDSTNVKYYQLRYVLLQNSFNQTDSALLDINRVIELEPSLWKAYFDRGVCLLLLDKSKEALLDFDRAIVLNEENAQSYYYRGNAKRKLGDMDGACQDWKKAKELGDTDGALLFFVECNQED